MKRARLFLHAVALLALIACASAPPFPDGETLDAQAFATADGFAFLPPVGPPVGTATERAGFDPTAELRIEIYALGSSGPTGPALGPRFTTADGSVAVRPRFFQALWRVPETRSATSSPRVRVEVVAASAPGGPRCLDASSVADAASGCLGFFDAQLRAPRGGGAGSSGALDLNRERTVPIKFRTGAPPGPPSTPPPLPPIQELVPGVDGRNCAVHEFNLPGQGLRSVGTGLRSVGTGLRSVGTVGGFLLLDRSGSQSPGDPAPIVRLLEPPEAGAWAAAIDGAAGPQRNTAILVVDDFTTAGGGATATLDPGFFDLGASPSLAQLEELVAGDGFSHGALVLHHLVAALAGAGFDRELRTAASSDAFRVFVRSVDAALPPGERRSVTIAAVETDGLDTDVIARRIRNAFGALSYTSGALGLEINRVAINMSFAIVPCAVLDAFEASDYELFEEYVAALAAENDIPPGRVDELVRLLLTPLDVDDEPLLAQIEACDRSPGPAPTVPLGEAQPWRELVRAPEGFGVSPWDGCGAARGVAQLDFEAGLAAGDVVAELAAGRGLRGFVAGGAVGIRGDNPALPGSNAAMIFDAACGGGGPADCSADDSDLYAPALGNVLIVSEDLDGGDPNDSSAPGNELHFDFSPLGSGAVDIEGAFLTVVDIDPSEAGSRIDLFSRNRLLRSVEFPVTGNGGVAAVAVDPAVEGVTRAVVRLARSAAIDELAVVATRPAPPSIVYVASAGNFGQPFPLYPAAWPTVLSGASQDAVEPSGYAPERSVYSNAGEVLAPGILYELSRDPAAPAAPSWALGYAGTSFSGPVLSLHAALDLARQDPRCALLDRSRLAHDDPRAYDTPLPDAVARYCRP